jgi:hypothetical protein
MDDTKYETYLRAVLSTPLFDFVKYSSEPYFQTLLMCTFLKFN